MIQILEDILRACVLNFPGNWDRHLPLVEFAYNNSYQASIQMAPYEALYGRKCRSPLHWDLDEVRSTSRNGSDGLRPEMIQESIDKVQVIKKNMKTAQDRQKSYADKRRKDLEFNIGDQVFLKLTPQKGIRRMGKSGKLTPRYAGPFDIVERIGPVAYRLDLPPNLTGIHDVFHVSQLRKYHPDPSHVIEHVDVPIQSDLTYLEQPVRIIDFQDRQLRNRRIPQVKVLWRNQKVEEATWEREDEMREKYPHLFG